MDVALLDTMSSLHIIRSNFSLVWDIVILSPTQNLVMQDAISKNKLYLSGESVEWFLIKNFKPIFQCSESPLDGHPQARVSKVEQLICIL
jgi:hypothetical protein